METQSNTANKPQAPRQNKPAATENFTRCKKCSAIAKSTRRQCSQPAMKNGKCRLHGGKSTGPKTKKGKDQSRLNGIPGTGETPSQKQLWTYIVDLKYLHDRKFKSIQKRDFKKLVVLEQRLQQTEKKLTDYIDLMSSRQKIELMKVLNNNSFMSQQFVLNFVTFRKSGALS